jgi:uridine kinase
MAGFVVSIAGGSASGKSTLAQSLAEALRTRTAVEVVSMDSFGRHLDPAAPHFFFEFTGESTFNFNHPESIDVDRVKAAVSDSDAIVVVLEGLMPLAIPALRSISDLKVFVDLDADVRAVRRMERDIRIERGGGDPKYIAAYYLECARIGHRDDVEKSKQFADLIVRGDAALSRTCGLLSQIVLANL